MERWSDDIKALIEKADIAPAYYLYRLPGEETACFGVSSIVMPFSEAADSKGFVVSPFAPDGESVIILPGSEWSVELGDDLSSHELSAEFDMECDKAEYLSLAESLVRKLRQRQGKTVLSRAISGRMNGHPIEAFIRLCAAYPYAMVFCWRLTASGDTWFGATPELLLKGDGISLHTMALAGTRKAGIGTDWDKKNIREQQMVTDFIVNCFENADVTVDKELPKTVNAGPVEHICTLISTSENVVESVPKLLKTLSPTPAVCGLPRADAMSEIMEHENFNREYYGGYCGPWNSHQKFAMYVMLRCMKYKSETQHLRNCNALLYAGGGLTAESIPEEEWKETCMKASTIINIIT